ncbi:tetratricopeptide repeat protein [Ancylostoma caninum]|uniref:Tetratricopeptide repeat protein n=1 Tax=Ancylostoma caninum TaxID=29170 RepID=A0A368FVX4_ANCCA|nr:tetratricopeptide repeat protein [Ancylostoma caninum]
MRLRGMWVEDIMRNNVAEKFIKNITENRIKNQVKFPQEEDLSGAATAILRLQDVYKLDSTDLSNGIILGEKVSHKLTAHDAFEVGRAAYNEKDYYHTLTWMQTALNRLENEEEKTISEAEILEYLAYALYQQGNVRRALALTKRLAALAPDHPRAKGNVKWYEDMLQGKDMEGDLPPIVNKRVEWDGIVERDAYEALCRGEVPPMDPAEEKLLYCYLKMDKPFLWLAPIKVEILRLDPLAVLFKEVMSDYEMEVIKATATPKVRLFRMGMSGEDSPGNDLSFELERATVKSEDGSLITVNYRISKSAWLKEEEHPVVARINRRVEDMTNLNQKTSEDLQVANYGLGGHYDPHFDFARIANYGIGGHYAPHFDMSTRGEKEPYRVNGNRIATVLFYKEEKNAFKTLNTGNRLATVLFYVSFD